MKNCHNESVTSTVEEKEVKVNNQSLKNDEPPTKSTETVVTGSCPYVMSSCHTEICSNKTFDRENRNISSYLCFVTLPVDLS